MDGRHPAQAGNRIRLIGQLIRPGNGARQLHARLLQERWLTVVFMTERNDQTEVSALLSRYYRAIDDKQLDRAAIDATFAPDARWISPTGVPRTGLEAIADQQIAAAGLFRATHHVTSDHIVEVSGDTARLWANVTAMHLWDEGATDPATLESHFLAGGVFEGQAARHDNGWRFTELRLRIVWRTGALPVHINPGAV